MSDPVSFPFPRPLVLIGMKGSGKTTVGRLLAHRYSLPFYDVDKELEVDYRRQTGIDRSSRAIFQQHGRDFFRQLEQSTLIRLAAAHLPRCILATGGGLPLAEANRPLLRQIGIILYLEVDEAVLLERITAHGIPPFFPYPDDPARSLADLLAERRPIYRELADLSLSLRDESPAQIADLIAALPENSGT